MKIKDIGKFIKEHTVEITIVSTTVAFWVIGTLGMRKYNKREREKLKEAGHNVLGKAWKQFEKETQCDFENKDAEEGMDLVEKIIDYAEAEISKAPDTRYTREVKSILFG